MRVQGEITILEDKHKCCWIKFLEFILGKGQGIGPFLQGIGLTMAGFATLGALYKTGDLYDKILHVQMQAEAIKSSVDTLNLLVRQQSSKLILGSSKIDNSKLTKKQVNEAIKKIPTSPANGSGIYLPSDVRPDVADRLLKADTVESRELILQNALKYDPKGGQ